MKKSLHYLSILALSATPVFAQNTYQEVTQDAGYYRLENTDNWSGGVLPDTTQGVINSTTVKARFLGGTNWDVIQNGGTVGVANIGTNIALVDSTWVVNGGTFGDQGFSLSGTTTMTVNSGGAVSGASNRDASIQTGSTLILNGGSLSGMDQLFVNGGSLTGTGTVNMNDVEASNGGTVTLSNSTVTITNNFGGRAQNDSGGGTYNLTDTTLSAGVFKVLSDNSDLQVNLDGTTGSATFGDWGTGGDATQDESIFIDFASGTGMTMTMTAPTRGLDLADATVWAANEWAEALWENNQLTYGTTGNRSTLGDWATVTSSGVGLGDGNLFTFDGNTLSVAAIPEPSTLALMSIAFLSLYRLRRRK